MIGGPGTSSRIAIAAALGFTLGGIAMGSNTTNAADLGGDCCADLEERVAELEATTVRKGNKKVSVTLSGWVIKAVNWWDDGDLDHFIVGDKDYDLGSRFAISGTAQIAPGWSAGYNLTILAPSTVFGFGANQFDDTAGTFGDISTLYSYMFIKSDKLGTLNWGHLSPASDNAAVLADISGTVIESNSVWFEGSSFLLRPEGGPSGVAGLSGLFWGNFLNCIGLGAAIGTDCWGAAQPAVRYDSPTWAGFSFKTSYGNNAFTGPALGGISEDFDFWDIAVLYAGEWGKFKEILTRDQIGEVLTKLEGHTLFPIVAVALGTGLRRGELLGLQWGDIDLDAATLRVERSVEETKVGLRLKAPKTRRGRRNIKLPADAVAVLRDHKVQQLEIRLALGMGKPDATTLVFSDVEGELLKPHTISRAWRRVVASKKLPAVTFHALRHTHASMLIREWTFSRSAAASATARQPSPWTYTAT
jgi:hypothetical protein